MSGTETLTIFGKLTPSKDGHLWRGKCPECGRAVQHGVPEGTDLPAHRLGHCSRHWKSEYFIDVAE